MIQKIKLAVALLTAVFVAITLPQEKLTVHAADEGKFVEYKLSDKTKNCIVVCADYFGLPREVVQATIEKESSGNPNATNETAKDRYVGLMQISEGLYADTCVSLGGESLYDELDNIMTGCYLLSKLYNKYNDISTALVAYNMGENAMLKRGITSSKYSEWILNRSEEIKAHNNGLY